MSSTHAPFTFERPALLRETDAVQTESPRCPVCKGSGIDPAGQHGRFTSGGKDEDPPCIECGGTGEVPHR